MAAGKEKQAQKAQEAAAQALAQAGMEKKEEEAEAAKKQQPQGLPASLQSMVNQEQSRKEHQQNEDQRFYVEKDW